MLTGNPWKKPAETFATPMPTISWFPRTRWPARAAKADDVEIVSTSATSAMPSAPGTSLTMSPIDTCGMSNGGNPWGRVPTTETPRAVRSKMLTAAMATTTAIRTAGNFGTHRCRTTIRISDIRPMASAAATVSPLLTPCKNAFVSALKLSAFVENPKSLGSWPMRIVSARPFM